ncbi:MAG: hypothetical protein DRQ55_11985 [Planctomycetota bacterium]|nr:MAG: hypothetical protein DRQ55_11985 [Planctomycetota bacterium]
MISSPTDTSACPRPLFIVGHGRSGTTLIRLMLNAHPAVHIPGETAFVSYLRRHLRPGGACPRDAGYEAMVERLLSRGWFTEKWIDAGPLPVDEVRACALAAPREPGGLMGALFSQRTRALGKTRWGDKVPNNYRFLDEIEAWFPDAQVLHMLRDGRDVAVSCLTPPFSDEHDMGDVYEVALRWRDALRRGARGLQRLGAERYRELRYEDLTADPARELRALCDWLGEPFDPAMLEYHRDSRRQIPDSEKAVHPRLGGQVDRTRVERWRSDAPPGMVAAFEGVAGYELRRAGYALSDEQPSPALAIRIAWERLRPRRIDKPYGAGGR